MTAYAVVMTLRLVSPWALVGVMIVGAALARCQRDPRDAAMTNLVVMFTDELW